MENVRNPAQCCICINKKKSKMLKDFNNKKKKEGKKTVSAA
jgi:hypothetical protein